jgi:hypothetical protein
MRSCAFEYAAKVIPTARIVIAVIPFADLKNGREGAAPVCSCFASSGCHRRAGPRGDIGATAVVIDVDEMASGRLSGTCAAAACDMSIDTIVASAALLKQRVTSTSFAGWLKLPARTDLCLPARDNRRRIAKQHGLWIAGNHATRNTALYRRDRRCVEDVAHIEKRADLSVARR